MKLLTFIKKLNNTELGKSTTHDSYILVPANVDLSLLFPIDNQDETFIDVDTKNNYSIRMRDTGREIRINGLGQYYLDKKLNAGDEIILQMLSENSNTKRFIDVNKYNNIIVFQKDSANSFEVLNQNRLSQIDDNTLIDNKNIKIEYFESRKKRADSPIETKYYKIVLGDNDIGNNYNTGEILELYMNDDNSFISKPQLWKIYEIGKEN